MRKVRDGMRRTRALLLLWSARLTSARAGIVIVYHGVGGDTSGDSRREILPSLSTAAFARQLEHLRRHYRVVPARDILGAVRARRRGDRFPAAVTFDDDLASHIREAKPALAAAGLPATFFLTGASLHGPHAFWWEDLQGAIDKRLVGELAHVPRGDLEAALEGAPKAIFGVADTIARLREPERAKVATALRAAVGPPAADS